jgi:hypothetical protein
MRVFPMVVFVLKYKQYLYVLAACVYCTEVRDMTTSSRVLSNDSRLGKHLLSKGIFQKPFLTDDLVVIGTRIICLLWRTIPFLVFDVWGSTVSKNRITIPLVRAPSLSRNLLHAAATQLYPCVLLLCVRWFSIRGLRFIPRIDPIVWCRVIHRLLISCRSPTPSAFLLRKERLIYKC